MVMLTHKHKKKKDKEEKRNASTPSLTLKRALKRLRLEHAACKIVSFVSCLS